MRSNSGVEGNHYLIEQFHTCFQEHRSEKRAQSMEAYMRNQFNFYGVPAPQRKAIAAMLIDRFTWNDPEDFIRFFDLCWQQKQREFKYLALDLSRRFIKRLDKASVPFFEKKIGQDSWWDTVDGIAPQIIGALLKDSKSLQKEYGCKWIESENFWYQRSAIILQLFYKEKTQFDLMAHCILRRADSKEFFVQKAVGWALRQFAKSEPEVVYQFLQANKIAPLSIREAIKSLK